MAAGLCVDTAQLNRNVPIYEIKKDVSTKNKEAEAQTGFCL